MGINWYPGHMKKTKDLIQENLKLVDVVVEVLDARIPVSSKNPQMDVLFAGKPRILVFNKMDLADRKVLKGFEEHYRREGHRVVGINSLSGKGVKQLLTEIQLAARGLFQKLERKGMRRRAVRTMIIGIPNVGKSSLINKLVGRKSAKTGDKPGVTRGKQWVRIRKDIELFDTPGILWPKIEDPSMALKLALTGAIKDELIPFTEAACWLSGFLKSHYPGMLSERYKGLEESLGDREILESIGRIRGKLLKKGEIDMEQAAFVLVDDFRSGQLGPIILDRP